MHLLSLFNQFNNPPVTTFISNIDIGGIVDHSFNNL